MQPTDESAPPDRRASAPLLDPSEGGPTSPGHPQRAASAQEPGRPEPRQHTLEWELGLDTSDLRSHAWFHGRLSRTDAEALLSADGDFLVRESLSQPGDYALSCRWNNNNIHFMINKMAVHAGTIYESEQYYLEDEPYETIPHLITGYVGVERPVSAASGARLRRPVTRTRPIGGAAPCRPAAADRLSWRASLTRRHRTASADPLTGRGLGQCQSASLSRIPSAGQLYALPGRVRAGERSPPPKPERRFDSRVYEEIDEPDEGAGARGERDGSDSGHGSGDSAQERRAAEPESSDGKVSPSREQNSATPKPMAPCSEQPPGMAHRPVPSRAPLRPVVLAPPSAFDVASFETLLLPLTHNAPLDATALRGVKLELLESSAPALAAHLTWWDLELIQGDGSDLGLGVTSGIELVTLPQGQQLRQDLLERSEWFTAFVIASIVCVEDDDERVQVINKWINVAVETKTALGNLYGFASIIQALCSSQVQRLYVAWHQVRQRFTSAAFEFDAQLRPCLRAMDEGCNAEAPNTCLPHLAPLAALLEQPPPEEPADFAASPEELSAALRVLTAGRQMAAAAAAYRQSGRPARAARDPAAATRDDLFRTEFHLRLLLGSRAAAAEQAQRRQVLVSRVHQVLAAVAQQRVPSPT